MLIIIQYKVTIMYTLHCNIGVNSDIYVSWTDTGVVSLPKGVSLTLRRYPGEPGTRHTSRAESVSPG